jgi:hypothetical protein
MADLGVGGEPKKKAGGLPRRPVVSGKTRRHSSQVCASLPGSVIFTEDSVDLPSSV